MKKIAGSLALVFVILLGRSVSLLAVPISSSPPPATSPDIIITSLVGESLNGSTDAAMLDYLELFNQSDAPISLDGWSFHFIVKDNGTCAAGVDSGSIALPAQWLLSKKYLTIVRGGDPVNSAVFDLDMTAFNNCTSSPWLALVEIDKDSTSEQTVEVSAVDSNSNPLFTSDKVLQHHQRNNSLSSKRTISGDLESDYDLNNLFDSDGNPLSLYSDPLYSPPTDTAGLTIVELLPHARNCSPLDSSSTCNDYIKLYNSSHSAIDLASYRLRTSYGGNQSSSSNTINLNGTLAAGTYTLVNTKNDGSSLSLTESGGYAWLEDTYGAATYKPVIEYPDASTIGKVGWSWALDGKTWRWSSSPQPNGPNIFPPSDIATLSLSVTSSLKPCASGQYRNPATNRCKSIATTASASSLKPCPAGQERNPATNRCRKSGSTLGASTVNVADVAAPSIASGTQWALAGGAMAAAIGYAVFEWRQEISLAFNDNKNKLLAALKNLRS